MNKLNLTVGTRGSAMALAQTHMVIAALISSSAAELHIEEQIIKTCGDSWQGTKKAASVDKRKWMGALEDSLILGHTDLVVHSAKDVPSEIHKDTVVLSVLKRANPQDIFIGKLQNGQRSKLASFNKTANLKVGTASLRRQMQFMSEYPNAQLVAHRGNVPTRIQNLDQSPDLDGIIIAAAGLERLGTLDVDFDYLSTDMLLPAVNQGILAVQLRRNDLQLIDLLKNISDFNTKLAFECERYVVEALQGGCYSALGVYAVKEKNFLRLRIRITGVISRTVLNAEKLLDLNNWQEDADIILKELKSNGSCALLAEAEQPVAVDQDKCKDEMRHA